MLLKRKDKEIVDWDFNEYIKGERWVEVRDWPSMEKKEAEMLEKLYVSLDLSVRALNKLLVVARTIADLEESREIHTKHLAEAVCYRTADKLGR